MSNSIITRLLYDRIIDVDLMWTESQPVDAVILVPGGSFLKRGEVGDTQSWNSLIRLTGYSHKEYITDIFGNVTARDVTPRGAVYRYRLTNPEHKLNFDMGRRPDGSYLAAGDKLLVNDGGRFNKYHIIESRDVSTDPGASFSISNKISIHCPLTGRKPGISFSVNLLQGANCYEMTLKICNLNLDIDIRKITHVRVKAGYRTEGFTQTFDCPVFSSYIESPNPDGVTVFKCLAVGKTDIFTENRPIVIHYLGGSVTIGDTIEAVSTGLGLKNCSLLLPEYSNLEIKMSAMNTVAENASSLIDWLRKIIAQRIQIAEEGEEQRLGKPQVIVQQDTDRNLFVYCANRKNRPEKFEASVPVLDAIKGASFNGVALTVKAAWNPLITPGVSFIMKPSIINGANLPNIMAKEDYGDDPSKGYRYRCITSSIAFSTTGEENEMSILAVPIKYMDSDTNQDSSASSIEKMAQSLYDSFKNNPGARYEISLGSADSENMGTKTEAQQVVEVQAVASRNMFDIDTTALLSDNLEYTVMSGDSMSQIAKEFYVNRGRCYASRINIPMKGKEPDLSVMTDSTKYIGEIGAHHLWPIIAVHTYNFYKLAESSQVALNKYESFRYLETNPNLVSEGKVVVIPRITSLDALKPLRNIFKYAAESYKNVEGYAYFIEAWTALYYYLGGS